MTHLVIIPIYDTIEEKRRRNTVKKATKILRDLAALELVRQRCRYELEGYVGENASLWHSILLDATDEIKTLELEFAKMTPSKAFRWDKPMGRKRGR